MTSTGPTSADGTDAHYVRIGRWCTILGVIVSIGTAYFVTHFKSIMDYMQALVSFFISPLFGSVIIGMLWKRATPRVDSGACLPARSPPIGMYTAFKIHPAWLRYVALSPDAKHMAENLYRALWSLIICVVRHHRGQPVHQAQDGRRAERTGAGHTPMMPERRGRSAVQASYFLGCRRSRHLCGAANHLLVSKRSRQ